MSYTFFRTSKDLYQTKASLVSAGRVNEEGRLGVRLQKDVVPSSEPHCTGYVSPPPILSPLQRPTPLCTETACLVPQTKPLLSFLTLN